MIELAPLGLQGQAYVSVRTDGNSGSGTLADPYDGSTPGKFDGLMKAIPAFSEVVLSPGTFLTRGYHYGQPEPDAAGWLMKEGWKLRGCGMEASTLQLVEADKVDNAYVAILGAWPGGSTAYYRNFSEVNDLTVDCNGAGNAQHCTLSAVHLGGSHSRIRKVRAINFSSTVKGGEGFPICTIGPIAALDSVQGMVTDQIIEDCIAERPYWNDGGIIAISLGSNVWGDGTQRFTRYAAIRRCVVDGQWQDGSLPYTPMAPNAYLPGKAQIMGLSWGNHYNCVYSDNVIRNVTMGGPYQDCFNGRNVIIRDNIFENVGCGPRRLLGSIDATGTQGRDRRVVIENNEISLYRITDFTPLGYQPVGIELADYSPLLTSAGTYMMDEVVIRGNRIGLMEGDMNPANFAGAGIYVTSAESLAIEDNEIRLPRSVAGPTDAHICLKNIGRLRARNNRRTENNSIISPWDVGRGIPLLDCDQEMESKLASLRLDLEARSIRVAAVELQIDNLKTQVAALQSQVKILQNKKGWFGF